MTNSKLTRRALFTSIMALVLCFAMLTGTTFAWFTDQETSGNNRIVAGNLDVDLLMYKGTGYVSIANGNGDIFQEGATANNSSATLWEPGKTQIAYLAIENKGNLDLKYKVELNVKDPENGKLYEVMTYTITPDAKNGDLPAWDDAKALAVKLGKQDVSEEVKLGNGATHYFALSIHMDEEADNDYMNDYVIFDLTVYATQVDSESDAFDNQYDADAFFDLSKDESGAYLLGSATDLLAFNAAANEEGFMGGEGRTVDIKLTADVDLTGKTWTPIEDMWITFDGNGHTIKNLTTASASRAGLFGYAGGVTIKNLTIENANVTGSQVGIFAGSGEGLTIENCFIKGQNTVTYIETEESAGGIGVVTGVSVNNNMNVEIVSGATVTLDGSTIQTTLVKADDYVGYKVAGYVTNSGTITNNGTISVIEAPVAYTVEGVNVMMTPSAYGSIERNRNNSATIHSVEVYTKEDLVAVNTLISNGVMVPNGTNDISAEIIFKSDIDFGGATWNAIGKDIDIIGNGCTWSNVNFAANANGQAGIYSYSGNCLVSDLTLKDITSTGSQAGAFAGNATNTHLTNCALEGNIVINWTATSDPYNGVGAVFGVTSGMTNTIGVDASNANITINNTGITYPTGFSAVTDNNLVGVVYGGSYTIE